MTLRITYKRFETNVRNKDLQEYKQSVFCHTFLGLNRRSHRSFAIVLRCLESAFTQTNYSNTFWIPVCITHKPKTFLWRCYELLEWCKHNPQPKSLTTLCKHYEKCRIHSLFNRYHSWCLYTHHSINIEWDSGLSRIE